MLTNHYFLMRNEEREAITFHGEDRELAMAAPDEQLVPAAYRIGFDPVKGDYTIALQCLP